MPEPITPAAATLVGAGMAVPVLAVAGVSLGIRFDVLIAGFAGAMAAMVLLDTVPRTSDTWLELLRTTVRRLGVALASAAVAGYLSPVVAALLGALLPAGSVAALPAVERAGAFLLGGGAQRFLKAAIDRTVRKVEEA